MSSYVFKNQSYNFNTIYYVQSSGNDTNDGTTISTPLKTIQSAISKCSSTGCAIVIGDGTFDVTTSANDGSLYDSGKTIYFFGNEKYTIIKNTNSLNTNRDQHIIGLKGNSKIFCCVLENNCGSNRSTNYMSSIVGNVYSAVLCELYNCVIVSNSEYVSSIIYDNSGGSNVNFYNCTFLTTYNISQSYTGAGCVLYYNVAFQKTKSDNTSTSGYVHAQSLDSSTYKILDSNNNKNYGVYSGTNAWSDSKILFYTSTGKTYTIKNDQLTYIKDGYPSVDDFLTNGNDYISESHKTFFSQNYSILSYSKNSSSSFLFDGKNSKKIIKTNDISLNDAEYVDSITIEGNSSNNSKIRIFVSPDKGTIFYSFKNNEWSSYPISDENFLLHGMSIQEFNSIGSNFNSILISKNKSIRFLFYLEIDDVLDSLYIDKISYQSDMKGTYIVQPVKTTYNAEYVSNNQLLLKLYESGTYKINF